VVHVQDASRVVGVVSHLLDDARRVEFANKNRSEQQRLRELYADRGSKQLTPYVEAQKQPAVQEWKREDIAKPERLGLQRLDAFPLAQIKNYIDWTFFFSAWELKGKFPGVLQHPEYGAAARELYQHGTALLEKIIAEGSLTARAKYGFWPANSEGDDIVLYADESRSREILRFNMLRQQHKQQGIPSFASLADFIAPKSSGLGDYIGAFAVTAGIGVDELVARYEAQHDDYNAIMVKALADRLAEAFAELMHQRARQEWGYGQAEKLSNEELIAEKYRGIRPAFGYPACPDHTEKSKLFELLQAGDIGMSLTEGYAMLPTASVSGLYLAHPASHYFIVGRLGKDQIESYAARKGISVAEAERWLAPNLAYDP
jgi:5-methyltetrahydrofolate--homocysteine methyltransferase